MSAEAKTHYLYLFTCNRVRVTSNLNMDDTALLVCELGNDCLPVGLKAIVDVDVYVVGVATRLRLTFLPHIL